MRPRSSVEVFTDKTGNGGPDGIVPKIESAYHRTCGVSVGYGFEQRAFQVPELCNITSPDRCARNTADSSCRVHFEVHSRGLRGWPSIADSLPRLGTRWTRIHGTGVSAKLLGYLGFGVRVNAYVSVQHPEICI